MLVDTAPAVKIGNVFTTVPGLYNLVMDDPKLYQKISYPDTPQEYKVKHIWRSDRPVPPILPVSKDDRVPTATFLHHYATIMGAVGEAWEDRRNPPQVTMDGVDPSKLVGRQLEVLTEMIDGRLGWGGLLLVTTSGGKTWLAGNYFKQLTGRGVFFVDDQLLGQQTREDLERVLGEKVGLIGAGKHDVRRITVCLFQSAHTKTAQQLIGCSAAFVDEIHTQLNDRAIEAVRRVEPLVIFGLTGTFDANKPYKLGQLFQIITSPEVIEYTPKEALAAKVVTKVLTFGVDVPMVVVVDNDMSPLDLHRKYVISNDWLHQFTAELTLHLTLESFSPVVFCHYREHISRVCTALKECGISAFEHSGRISRSTRYSKRKEMSATKTQDVIVATNATFAKGASVHTLSAGIGVSQGGWEGTIQSIGRLMRLHESKPYAVYFDVAITSPPGKYGIQIDHKFAASARVRRQHIKKNYPYQNISVDYYADPVAEAARVWAEAKNSLRS
jgi:superfamily II DNA or RNA helicase